jgi:haloalkane dehalogenase
VSTYLTPILDSTMYHVENGIGAPIVFLHGNPTSSYLWRNVMPRLEGEGRLLAPDLIGMGKSGKPHIDYRYPSHERYLDAWFDALDLRDVTLVIHDWGSTLGLSWARRHADRVKAIAMMEPIFEPYGWPVEMSDLLTALRTEGIGEKLILDENRFVEDILPSAMFRALSREEMDAYRAPFPDRESRRPTLAWPRCIPLDGEPRDVLKVVEQNVAWLSSSDVPKLLLTFEPGVLVTPNTVEWCRTRFTNLSIENIGPGLHFVQEDQPQAIGDAVKNWRRRVSA